MLSINIVEAAWILVNLVTFSLTLTALVDARADREAVKLLNGHARELAANGIVRREAIRLVVQLLLLSVAVPGLFSDREITLSPPLMALIAVPVLILLSSFFDARDRKALTVLVAADLLVIRASADKEILAAIANNTTISQGARDDAREAAEVANHINDKLARQGDALILQGEERAERLAHTETVVDETAEKVADLHEGTAPEVKPA